MEGNGEIGGRAAIVVRADQTEGRGDDEGDVTPFVSGKVMSMAGKSGDETVTAEEREDLFGVFDISREVLRVADEAEVGQEDERPVGGHVAEVLGEPPEHRRLGPAVPLLRIAIGVHEVGNDAVIAAAVEGSVDGPEQALEGLSAASVPVVVVADDAVRRRAQRSQGLAEEQQLFLAPRIAQIAGEEHEVRWDLEGIDVLDDAMQ